VKKLLANDPFVTKNTNVRRLFVSKLEFCIVHLGNSRSLGYLASQELSERTNERAKQQKSEQTDEQILPISPSGQFVFGNCC
jgi:hypothetical protein